MIPTKLQPQQPQQQQQQPPQIALYLDQVSLVPYETGKALWEVPKRLSALAADVMKKTVRWSSGIPAGIQHRHPDSTSPLTSPPRHHRHHSPTPHSSSLKLPTVNSHPTSEHVTDEVLVITVEDDDQISITLETEIYGEDPHISSLGLTRSPSQWEVRQAIWNEIRT